MANLAAQFRRFLHKKPSLGKDVYIARGAVVLGDVALEKYRLAAVVIGTLLATSGWGERRYHLSTCS